MNHLARSFFPSILSLALVAGVAAPRSAAWAQGPAAKSGSKRLGVGDPAPALAVASWVKGEQIKAFEPGTAYVVDFWGTDIGPCRKSIPHLGRLAAKYKDKGVKVIGVSIWEETVEKDGKTPRSPLPAIEKFVAEMGDKMNYSVAYGGDDAEMVRTWMTAANRVSIPTAFVVDKQGRIAWLGHPMEGLEETLEAVTSGAFDPKAAQDAAKKKEQQIAKARELGARLRQALQGGRAKESTEICREMLRVDPKLFPNACGIAFQQVAVNMGEQDLAYAFARDVFAGPLKDSEQDLNTIAWTILTEPAIKKRDLDLALAMATRAVEITQGKDGPLLDTLARAHWEKGEDAKAVEAATRAATAAKADPKLPAAAVEEIVQALEKYKAGRK
ncbi:MAG: TlpA disulfide reductase family protein [Phycisphaerae bacterium]|jgi:thiol-disulfide isomerase/thioredoxin